MKAMRRCALGALASGMMVTTPTAVAQQAVTVVAPSFRSWSFSDAVGHDSLSVKKAWQWTLPVSTSVTVGRVTIDATGAVAVGRVGLEGGESFELSGLTDLRVRGVARVIGDQLLVTLGVNAPVGATRLVGPEVDALGILGSTALGFQTPTLGNGFGVTGGLVYAWRVGEWGLALGSTVETRARYTPIEARLVQSAQPSPADLKPGNAYRFSFGADRLIGQGRLSILVASEVFAESQLRLSTQSSAEESRYTLGPQFSGTVLLDLGVRGFRSFRVQLMDRYRTKFTGFAGEKEAGSSGNLFEGAVEFVTGSTRGTGIYVRADARLDSGLEVDNTITTAAMTSGGISVGLAVLSGRVSVVPYVRAQIGQLDTGPISTTATGFGGGIAVTLRH